MGGLLLRILLIGIATCSSRGESSLNPNVLTKTWLGDMNFLNDNNWNLKRRPCWRDRAILPDRLELALRIPDGETILAQLVLPWDGEVLLPKIGALNVVDAKNGRPATDGKESTTCSGQDIVFLRSRIPLWVDPNNWNGHNAATPDLEAIPCATDKAVFPDTSLSVQMPDVPLKVAAINVFGTEYEGRMFNDFLASEVGRSAFFRSSRTALPDVHITNRLCDDPTGCECDNDGLREAVCRSRTDQSQCAIPLCLQPVLPPGNCCPICGGFVLFKYSSSFKMEKFQNFLNEKFRNENVDYFASKSNGLIQVVLVERGNYAGKVDDYTKDLKETVLNTKNLGLDFVKEFAAGPYISPTSFFSVLRLSIGLLFLALVAFAVIFCVHTEECKVNTNGQRQYSFAVFENQGEEVELCKPEMGEPVAPPRSRRQAFDNPMYGAASQETHNLVEEEEEEDEDREYYKEDSEFSSSMEESSHIYATMETVDLLGKLDATSEEQISSDNLV